VGTQDREVPPLGLAVAELEQRARVDLGVRRPVDADAAGFQEKWVSPQASSQGLGMAALFQAGQPTASNAQPLAQRQLRVLG
jgi:hypothetical protein